MYIYWHNGALRVEPENEQESDLVEQLWLNAANIKCRIPPENVSHGTYFVGSPEQRKEREAQERERGPWPNSPVVGMGIDTAQQAPVNAPRQSRT